jgi:cytochrome c oxidase assembly protein subunit 15
MQRSRSVILPVAPDNGLAFWLFTCAAAVFAMVVIGGVTRLTDSGLSMVEWRPLMGILPPLSDAEWQRVFGLYQQSPQFQLVNASMTLTDFKTIFWWEYIHRLWGRLIGLFFVLPLIWFFIKGRIDGALGVRLFGLLLLGAAQGFLGWYMVKSGLVDRPEVSQYRLTAHLALALLLYAASLSTALALVRRRDLPLSLSERAAAGTMRPIVAGFILLIAVTILAGGFMAGTDAGRTFTSYPLMDGRLFPSGYFHIEPWFANPFENVTAINFNHRWLGTLTALYALVVWLLGRNLEATSRRLTWPLIGVVSLQFGLGIATLLSAVPIDLAAAHQAGAVLLLTVGLGLYHEVGRSLG